MLKTRVLIVDDSLFFRKRLQEVLSEEPQIEVIGFAANGKEAVAMASEKDPDVITMDIEMPVMDGITAVRQIMKQRAVPILILSSFSTEGARATLDALDAGAVDYVPKRLADLSDDHEEAKKQLCARILSIGARRKYSSSTAVNDLSYADGGLSGKKRGLSDLIDLDSYRLIIIGASTGGPPVVQEIIKSLPEGFHIPIVIVQHMPESFTGPFADRLNKVSKVNVVLARNGESLKAGSVYITPGGHQLKFTVDSGGNVSLSVKRSGEEYTYKPCIDVSFKSAASSVDGKILAVVLTGMGSDGMEGARELKQKNSTIIVQDKESSVVYGMPMMVAKAGLADIQLAADEIAKLLARGH